MEHLFDIKLAKKYGVNAAIFIRHLMFWIIKNKATGKNFHDDRTWTYMTIEGFQKIFSYWSVRQIRVIRDKLIARKVIIKGEYNQQGYDRTSWYAFYNEKAFVKIDKWSCQNGQVELSERASRPAENDQPIPNPIPNELTDKPTVVKSSREILELDLKIAEQRKFFLKQIQQILPARNTREAQTFARITQHLVRLAQDGTGPCIFKDAIEWAKSAAARPPQYRRGLFVAKVKQETGFAKQKMLLKTGKTEITK